MIHALLFVTNDDRDRDSHGPEFRKHMRRINRLTGANVTVSALQLTKCYLADLNSVCLSGSSSIMYLHIPELP